VPCIDILCLSVSFTSNALTNATWHHTTQTPQPRNYHTTHHTTTQLANNWPITTTPITHTFVIVHTLINNLHTLHTPRRTTYLATTLHTIYYIPRTHIPHNYTITCKYHTPHIPATPHNCQYYHHTPTLILPILLVYTPH
jgi:hypothetical protein